MTEMIAASAAPLAPTKANAASTRLRTARIALRNLRGADSGAPTIGESSGRRYQCRSDLTVGRALTTRPPFAPSTLSRDQHQLTQADSAEGGPYVHALDLGILHAV